MPKRSDISTILLIGSGPIVIGQACEFDYSGTQAAKTLKNLGYRVILINSNPATIMTDPDFAHRTYIEPITEEVIAHIIKKEKVDAILPTMGGQTALNVAMSMFERGMLKNVEFLGAKPEAIKKGEDRQAFKEAMLKIGMDLPKSRYAYNEEEALEAAKDIGFPLIIRASYTLAGGGSGVAYNIEEFKNLAKSGLEASPISEILIEESLLGWKEFEMEVIRDKNDNCIIVCSIENLDPMGIHTGDSITIAPALTLTDKEYQRMRDASFKILREIGVDTGGSNVQFAINPSNGRMTVIEMNPRVSRSSALASKATGYPIAKVATMLAVGFSLDEITNDITGTPASFEPSIDYIVSKIPRFTFEKFPQADSTLSTSMKSIGEVMAIGGSFKESLQKALCSLEYGYFGLNSLTQDIEIARKQTRRANAQRILYVADCFRLGLGIDEVYELCKIDRWFLSQIYELVNAENLVRREILTERAKMRYFKAQGFSDRMLCLLLAKNEGLEVSEDELYTVRKGLGVVVRYEEVDTCAAEFPSLTSYLYSTIGDFDDMGGNSSLGNHSADLANFEGSQTSSLTSPSKFAKNHESNTANTRILKRAKIVDSKNRNVNSGVDSKKVAIAKEDSKNLAIAKAKNAEPHIAEGFLGYFRGFQGRGAGIYLDGNEQAAPVESAKRAKKPTQEANSKDLSEISRLCETSEEIELRSSLTKRDEALLEISPNTEFAKVLIIGGGPNRIGQGIEFDYCCVHSSFALRDMGIKSIMYNCNPETVSTDYDTSDVLYFEPIDFEHIRALIERENPNGIIVHFGGQTPLKLANALENINAKIIGTSAKVIDIAEDREKFAAFVRKLNLKQPKNGIAFEKEKAYKIAQNIGYPVLVRPSYVLGGRAMKIIQNDEELRIYMDEAVRVSESSPVLIDKFLDHAIELDVDAICDSKEVYIGGIMEHIEEAGIHSGDSASILPSISLDSKMLDEIRQSTQKIALGLGIIGLLNIQYAIYNNELFLIEVNPRASRTVPFVSKATGIPLAKVATRVMWQGDLREALRFYDSYHNVDFTKSPMETKTLKHIAVKESVFPFNKLQGADLILGPEMKSTGEVMGIGANFGISFAKSQLACKNALPLKGTVFISLANVDKANGIAISKALLKLGFSICATRGTFLALESAKITATQVLKVSEGRPNIVDLMANGEIALAINTSDNQSSKDDARIIRQHILRRSVPYFTTLSAAKVAIEAIKKLKADSTPQTRALQDYLGAKV